MPCQLTAFAQPAVAIALQFQSECLNLVKWSGKVVAEDTDLHLYLESPEECRRSGEGKRMLPLSPRMPCWTNCWQKLMTEVCQGAPVMGNLEPCSCLLYTSDAADD